MCKRALLVLAALSLGLPAWADPPGEVASEPATELPAPILSQPPATEASEPTAEDQALEIEYPQGRGRVWGRAEYLMWWTKDSVYPPLLTTGFTTAPRPGALGNPGTKILFGGNIVFEEQSGARFTLGLGLDDDDQVALEGTGFFLGSRSKNIERASIGNPILARPFFDVLTGTQNSALIAFPGLATGSVTMNVETELWGAEANLFANLIRSERFRLDLLLGFRYLNLYEELNIKDVSTVVKTGIPFSGRTITTTDFFGTDNNFYGGQIGLRADLRESRWHLNLLAKLAMGGVHEIVDIHGQTTVDTTPTTVFNAGLLALASNSGQFERGVFAVVPEAAAQVGFQLTDRCQAFVAYTFIYWSRVARPGDQVDLNLNTNQIPTSTTFNTPGGPAQPTFPFRNTDFYAHGVNLGLAFRY